MLDENEFLSPYGVRALSKYHKENPYILYVNGEVHRVDYEEGESSSGLFGGNSNWRGPIWFPVNYLLIESLQKFHHYFGDSFLVFFFLFFYFLLFLFHFICLFFFFFFLFIILY